MKYEPKSVTACLNSPATLQTSGGSTNHFLICGSERSLKPRAGGSALRHPIFRSRLGGDASCRRWKVAWSQISKPTPNAHAAPHQPIPAPHSSQHQILSLPPTIQTLRQHGRPWCSSHRYRSGGRCEQVRHHAPIPKHNSEREDTGTTC